MTLDGWADDDEYSDETVMRTILHIGLHRTGTTSAQTFLQHHLGPPAYPVGELFPHLQLETALVALRPDRLGPVGAARGTLDRDLVCRWAESAREAGADLVLSNEVLSFLRHRDEVDRLLDLLAAQGVTSFEVILVHRDPATFLPSYRIASAIMRESALADLFIAPPKKEIREGSWLVDHEARVALWSARCTVHVLSYEDEVARCGSVVPAIARLVGVEPPAADADTWLNSSAELRSAVEEAIREKFRQD